MVTASKTRTTSNTDQTTKKSAISEQSPSLTDELLQLNDKFVEYSEVNAFLCHAFATSLSEHEWLDQEIISGARRCSNWLQSRTSDLRDDMQHALARYVAEQEEKQSAKG